MGIKKKKKKIMILKKWILKRIKYIIKEVINKLVPWMPHNQSFIDFPISKVRKFGPNFLQDREVTEKRFELKK